MARLWRAFHDATGLAPGMRIALDDEEAHHVRRVLRLGPGDRIAVFDGRGGEWEAVIAELTGPAVAVELTEVRDEPVEPGLDLTLYQGRARPERFEWVVQKATELGVSAVVALDCERSEGPAPDEKRLVRWRRVAAEACKQSGRRRLPSIGSAAALPAVAPGQPSGLFLDTAPGAPPLGDRLAGPAARRIGLAVGPEGGFTPQEAAAAAAAGWLPASLGPRILRTETAGIVACALVLHRWADLGCRLTPEPPPP